MNTKDLKLLLLVPLVVFSSCKAQTDKGGKRQSKSENNQSIAPQTDSADAPKFSVKVNKRYDENGNLIKYDSSYSYSYTSPEGMRNINTDTVYQKFRDYFQKNYSNFLNSPMNEMFYQDSLFKYDFFNNDYFMKRFEMNNEIFNRMYRQMDSLKGDFLKKNYPGGQQKKNNQL